MKEDFQARLTSYAINIHGQNKTSEFLHTNSQSQNRSSCTETYIAPFEIFIDNDLNERILSVTDNLEECVTFIEYITDTK